MRQHFFAEFRICAHLVVFGGHANMGLINDWLKLFEIRQWILPLIGLVRIPHLGIKNFGLGVLHHPGTPGRDPVSFSTFPADQHKVKVPVGNGTSIQGNLPVAMVEPFKTEFLLGLPVVKGANQEYLRGMRRPFAHHPGMFLPVQTKPQVPAGKRL